MFAGLIALLPGVSGWRRQRIVRGMMLARAGLLAALTVGIMSCGGGASYDPPPPLQSYSITVTASAGGGSQSIVLTLTVEP